MTNLARYLTAAPFLIVGDLCTGVGVVLAGSNARRAG